MKKTIRVTAKKVDDAISQGLEILGVSIVEAEVRVISEGGFLKKAEVEITIGEDDEFMPDADAPAEEKPAVKVSAVAVKTEKLPQIQKPAPLPAVPVPAPQVPKPRSLFDKFGGRADECKFGGRVGEDRTAERPREEKNPLRERPPIEKRQPPKPRESAPATKETILTAKGFVSKILSLSQIEGTVSAEDKNGLSVKIETQDSVVIGHRGETLDALQYLVSQIVNGGESDKFVAVTVDAMGYRQRRSETLCRMAQKAAEKCIAQNRRVSLDSMNNSDRKEIHAYLSENSRVVTRSEGTEPNRRIVIYPAK